MTHLSPGIAELLVRSEHADGLNVSSLKKGTILKVRTMRSEYVVQLLGDGDVLVAGGKFFPKPTRAIFNGSTWGGSLMKLGWIGDGMSMEFGYQTKNGPDTVVTSGVRAVKVIADDGITFLLEWEPQACTA